MLALFLIPYFLGLLIFIIMSSFAIYRLLKFGAHTAGTWAALVIFSLGTVVVMAITLLLLPSLNWQALATPQSINYGFPAI